MVVGVVGLFAAHGHNVSALVLVYEPFLLGRHYRTQGVSVLAEAAQLHEIVVRLFTNIRCGDFVCGGSHSFVFFGFGLFVRCHWKDGLKFSNPWQDKSR